MNQPLVSIIIPVYNAENYISQTIQSALDQTWAKKEIIVVDDGSKDASLKEAEKYAAHNVKIITQKNQGASVARNTGLKVAGGDYIQFLDADDIITPEKIASQLQVLNGSVTKLALSKTVHFFDGDDYRKELPTADWYNSDTDDPVDFLLKLYAGIDTMPGYGGMIQPNAWLTPMKLIEKAGMWNEFRCPDDDGEFFCRVLLASDGIKFSDTGLNYYRKYRSGNSLAGQKSLWAYESLLLSIDLKYKYLKERTADSILDRIFARHYSEIAVASYPRYKKLSDKALKKAGDLVDTKPIYKSGKIATYLSRIFGWRIIRILTYLRYGI